MFEVGDRVRIKENAYEIPDKYISFLDPMKYFCGHEDTVWKIEKRRDTITYKLENTLSSESRMNGDGHWMFVDEWLELVGPDIEINEKDLKEMFS